MATRIFGIFIFGTNSAVIYRFLTDDLCAHLKESFGKRGLYREKSFQRQ